MLLDKPSVGLRGSTLELRALRRETPSASRLARVEASAGREGP